jgi:hypothetical protein
MRKKRNKKIKLKKVLFSLGYQLLDKPAANNIKK